MQLTSFNANLTSQAFITLTVKESATKYGNGKSLIHSFYLDNWLVDLYRFLADCHQIHLYRQTSGFKLVLEDAPEHAYDGGEHNSLKHHASQANYSKFSKNKSMDRMHSCIDTEVIPYG